MSSNLQAQLFQYIKGKLPPQTSLADEVAAQLEISTDSAYRRIRGEKSLSLEEVYRLCIHYKVSLDGILNLQTDAFLFTGNFVQSDTFRFKDWLINVVQQVKYMNSFKENQLFYLAKDIPIFHHFHFREVAAFKYYFWMKNILNLPEFAAKKFRIDDYPNEYFELGKEALSWYNKINSTELWNIETLNSTIRQVEYYHESNAFSSLDDIYAVYEGLEKLIAHMELQASEGYKFDAGDAAKTPLAPYQMYFNEIIILENATLAILDKTKTAFLIHNVLNVMMTRDPRFCDNMYGNIQNLVKKSTLISTVSERERSRFFNYLRRRIQRRKENLKAKTGGFHFWRAF
jgi:hypothetical protein